MNNKLPLVIYHADCMDGSFAAYAIWERFREDAEYVGLTYENRAVEFPKLDIADRQVIIVDFSIQPTTLTPELCARAKHVVILDHHSTAMKEWHDLFAENRAVEAGYSNMELCHWSRVSGAGIAWAYRHALHSNGDLRGIDPELILQHAPKLIQHVSDRDLWANKIPNSHEVHAYMVSRGFLESPIKFQEIHNLVESYEKHAESRDWVYRAGMAIMRAESQMIRTIVDLSASTVTVGGHVVPICPMPRQLASEAGHYLSKDQPFSITYWDSLKTGKRQYELRSEKDRGVHVGNLAEQFGGGGHAHAAGFYKKLADIATFNFEL